MLSGPARLEDCPLSIDHSTRSNGCAQGAAERPKGSPVETVYLHDIVVKPEARQFGVGKRLLEAVEDLAVTLGAPTITLTAVAGAW